MVFITEQDLRDKYNEAPFRRYIVKEGEKLTPGARQFLIDFRIDIGSKIQNLKEEIKTSSSVDSNIEKKQVQFEDLKREIDIATYKLVTNLIRFDKQKALLIKEYLQDKNICFQGFSVKNIFIEKESSFNEKIDFGSIYIMAQIFSLEWDHIILKTSHEIFFNYLDNKDQSEDLRESYETYLIFINSFRGKVLNILQEYFENISEEDSNDQT